MSTKSQSIRAGLLLLEKVRSDKALLDKIEAAESYQDFLVIAQKEGFDLSGLTEQEARGLAQGDARALGEITDEDLRRVAGGILGSISPGLAGAFEKQPGDIDTSGARWPGSTW
jgi:predicted ribosomally synthesized peptide with nif11-like leader